MKKRLFLFLILILIAGCAEELPKDADTTQPIAAAKHYEPVEGSINWQKIGPGAGGAIISTAIQPDNENIIYLGSDVAGIHKTIDGGKSWKAINNNLAFDSYSADAYGIVDITIDPSNENKATGYKTIYLSTWQGILKSTNGGESWKLIYPGEGEPAAAIGAIAIDPNNPKDVYAVKGNVIAFAGSSIILKSADAGSTWREIKGAGIDPNALIFSLLISPKDSSVLYASSNKGVYKSNDYGESWTAINNGLPHTDARIMALSKENNEIILYVVLNSHASLDNLNSLHCLVYKKSETEQSWKKACGNLPLAEIYGDITTAYSGNDMPIKGSYKEGEATIYSYYQIAAHPTNPSIVYVGTFEIYGKDEWKESWPLKTGIFKTNDGGKTWEHSSRTDISIMDGNKEFIDPTLTPNKNTNYGWITTWGMHVIYLEISQSNPEAVIWGAYDAYKTTDAGKTWNQIYTEKTNDRTFGSRGLDVTYVYDIDFDPNNENIIYIGYDDIALWRSKDKGSSLIKFKQFESDTYLNNDAANQLIVDPDKPSNIYVAGTGNAEDIGQLHEIGNIYKSTDYGETFIKINKGLPNDITQLELGKNSNKDSKTLYAAIYRNSIYKTTDEGNSWKEISKGISKNDKKYVWRLAIDPVDSNVLYAGVNSKDMGDYGGIYKTTDEGNSWEKLDFPNQKIISLAVDPYNNKRIFAGTFTETDEAGLYKSDDAGLTWKKVLAQPKVSAVAFSSTKDVIYAASSQWFGTTTNLEPGIYKSADGGNSWIKYDTSLGHGIILFMKVNPLDNSLYVGTHGNGLLRGIDKNEPAVSKSTSSTIPAGWEPTDIAITVLDVVPCEESYKTDLDCAGQEDWCKAYYKLYCAAGKAPTDAEVDAEMAKYSK